MTRQRILLATLVVAVSVTSASAQGQQADRSRSPVQRGRPTTADLDDDTGLPAEQQSAEQGGGGGGHGGGGGDGHGGDGHDGDGHGGDGHGHGGDGHGGGHHDGVARFPFDFRPIDGREPGAQHPERGAAGQPFLRLLPADYGDGLHAPAGGARPSPRQVSNLVVAQPGDRPNGAGASDMLWQWGQFLDHDLDETPVAVPSEAFDIPVPTGDVWFDPQGTGTVTIPLDRSAWELHDGVRQQVNELTAFLDASNVYGSDPERAAALRANDGTGRLATSAGDLLPYNEHGLPNAPAPTDAWFLAGDIRANEQVGLTAMHTLFVREHNHWADRLRAEGVEDGDLVYVMARALVGAEMQVITYHEFLPLLLGKDALPPYHGYHPQTDPGISNEFATAAYRVGHTLLSPTLERHDADGPHVLGPLPLSEAFFSVETFLATGPDPLLRGLTRQPAQEIDPYLVDGVRNLLFGPPGAGGFDLASLNIQRGRDHGLPSYVDLRRGLGLGEALVFEDVTSDPALAQRLTEAYGEVEAVDAWVGLLAEDHAPGALVGPTLRAVLVDQFTRLRDGDRYWYESYLPPEDVAWVESQTLATILRRNTGLGDELQDDVFRVRASPGQVADALRATADAVRAALPMLEGDDPDPVAASAALDDALATLAMTAPLVDTLPKAKSTKLAHKAVKRCDKKLPAAQAKLEVGKIGKARKAVKSVIKDLEKASKALEKVPG